MHLREEDNAKVSKWGHDVKLKVQKDACSPALIYCAVAPAPWVTAAAEPCSTVLRHRLWAQSMTEAAEAYD
jgi:hypothetical protein